MLKTHIQSGNVIFKSNKTETILINERDFFLKKIKINEPNFEDVLDVIGKFIGELYASIVVEKEYFGSWNPNTLTQKNHQIFLNFYPNG